MTEPTAPKPAEFAVRPAQRDKTRTQAAGTGVGGADATPGWRVRAANGGDIGAAVAAVEALLVELGGRRPSGPELEAEVRALLGDPELGVLLLAEAGGEVVGLLGASRQRAMHVPGPYLTIQDLWVDPAWRSRRIGAALIEAIAAVAREQGITRLEVGLPRETFEAIAATEAFYLGNGFELLGARMRRLLS
jgi:GNAT superfamily N-acetyltransferase